jgi:hypothetical protein
MTRRGSLAYYSVAVVLGSVLMTIAVWLPGGAEGSHWSPSTRGASGLFVACFFGLLLGAIPAILFGFFLRRIMALFQGLNHAVGWIISGSIVGCGEMWILGLMAGLLRPRLEGAVGMASIFLLAGPDLVLKTGLWATVPVAAVTSFYLFRVKRAFELGNHASLTETASKN